MSKNLIRITTAKFVQTFSDIYNSPDRHFCFILGAGASRSSGIRTGRELAQSWLDEIKIIMGDNPKEFEEFIITKNIDLDNPGTAYSQIYEERFSLDVESGFEYINKELEDARPGYGYSVLAQILASNQHNVVITTNFDNLTEEALYTYTPTRPLVCGHELLATFAKPSAKRPLIIKIHRDRFLNPQSREEEISVISKAWIEALNQIFKNSVPVFIGYGGNDGSMMGYLEEILQFENIFWCERKGTEVSERVKLFLDKHQGKLIEIDGFDELMFLLQAKLKLPLLNDEIESIASERAKNYRETFEEIQKRQSESPDREVKDAAEKIIEDAGTDWWSWQLKIDSAKSDEEKRLLYIQALKKLPNSPQLNGNYANLLHDLKKYDDAELYYKKALTLDPNSVNYNGNYAVFLGDAKKNWDEAETYHKKAIQIDPNDTTHLGNYALFLYQERDNPIEAEKYYQRVLKIDPHHSNNNCNYAGFLFAQGRYTDANKYLDLTSSQELKDDTKAEMFFYYYAHVDEKRSTALLELKKMLCCGVRSFYFILQKNVDRAIQDGHPDPLMLQRLADILTKDGPIGDLCDKKD